MTASEFLKDLYIKCAMSELNSVMVTEQGLDILDKALTELEELKKRDTAMKPILIHYNSQHYNCPMCNETISIENSKVFNRTFNKYCKYCGQQLDWSDKDE